MVSFLVLDSGLVEAALDLGALGLREPDADVVAWAAALVEREARVADVRHHGMAFGLDDVGAEDAFVGRCRCARVVRLKSRVVEPWHARGR